MRGGELLETGTTESVLERPEHGYTQELISAVPGRRTPGV
jgi:peptide/nickel transport system ATP-binding protein